MNKKEIGIKEIEELIKKDAKKFYDKFKINIGTLPIEKLIIKYFNMGQLYGTKILIEKIKDIYKKNLKGDK